MRLFFGLILAAAWVAPAAGAPRVARKPALRPRAVRKPAKAVKPPAKPARVSPEEALNRHPLIQRLSKPLESGPGVLVCEPVGPEEDASLVRFGAGCARWLHLVVGGQGDLGKTPLWTQVGRVLRQTKRTDLRLRAADVGPIARGLGLTHLALGEIRREGDACTLSYQWWDVAARQNAGTPVVLRGSREEIAGQLPEAAKRLVTSLGGRLPDPPPVGESPSELEEIGQWPWAPRDGGVAVQLFSRRLASHAQTYDGAGAESAPSRRFLGAFYALLHAGAMNDSRKVLELGERLQPVIRDNALLLGDTWRLAVNKREKSTKNKR